ncbi:LysR family transcriptional regulator [Paraburkholderia silviterrae]|uniref:LysR family transcriptional regulator n=1 Tax=Paraburkholderia silviterrae TaxID=2528715 RepID=A0A4R5LXH7_9BURK|nr:LysR family transcriptional regulator [Paraburkholderia silviterrae]TDG16701.1 LysR family transcriptional regulator [Paraburkholderia silviterrae]
MELKHLRAFVALAEELHFGRAAERLCIVQPALSMQIKALEEELGVRLFERDRHRVALSETGTIFLPEARATLHQAARAEQTARRSARGEIGTLRVAFVSSVLPRLLPALMRTMHARYPMIALELKDMSTPEQIAALHDGKLDFGLIRLPVSGTGLEIREVMEEPFVVAVHEDHALARKAQIRPADLRGCPAFVLARRYAPGLYDEMLLAFRRQRVSLEIAAELGEYTTMLALISAGLGIGVIPTHAAMALPPKVLAKPLDLREHRTGIGLAWRDVDSPAKRLFVDVVEACAREA